MEACDDAAMDSSTDDDAVGRLRAAHARTSMIGWDFSVLEGRMRSDDPWWDFEADCLAALRRARRAIDLGTGGGERLLRLLDGAPGASVVATEGWPPNVEVARAALGPRGVEVLAYDAETREPMPFDDASIDLVMSRHEAIDPREIARVLAPGGRLLTQQVDGADAEEIHEWFGTDPQYPEVSSERMVRDLEAAGLRIDAADDWAGTMEFEDAEALVIYLALVPWDSPGFSVDDHAERLLALDADRPIRVTQRRFRILASRDGVRWSDEHP